MNEEMAELMLEVWEERAETYERVGCEDEAYQVRMCKQEFERWVLEDG